MASRTVLFQRQERVAVGSPWTARMRSDPNPNPNFRKGAEGKEYSPDRASSSPEKGAAGKAEPFLSTRAHQFGARTKNITPSGAKGTAASPFDGGALTARGDARPAKGKAKGPQLLPRELAGCFGPAKGMKKRSKDGEKRGAGGRRLCYRPSPSSATGGDRRNPNPKQIGEEEESGG